MRLIDDAGEGGIVNEVLGQHRAKQIDRRDAADDLAPVVGDDEPRQPVSREHLQGGQNVIAWEHSRQRLDDIGSMHKGVPPSNRRHEERSGHDYLRPHRLRQRPARSMTCALSLPTTGKILKPRLTDRSPSKSPVVIPYAA